MGIASARTDPAREGRRLAAFCSECALHGTDRPAQLRHGDDLANLNLVLAQISDVDDPHRGAAFICSAVLVLPDGREFSVEGKMPGRLIREPRGTNGFGYDPIFVPAGLERTSAELSPGEKDAISHRGHAFRELASIVAEQL